MDDVEEIESTGLYSLVRDGDGFYEIRRNRPYGQEVPSVTVEGDDITSVTFGRMYFDTWSDLEGLSDVLSDVMSQLGYLEEVMRGGWGRR